MSSSNQIGHWDTALEGLGEAQRQQIARAMRSAVFAPRQALFRQGERSTDLLVIEAGSVRVFHVTENGDEFTIGLATAGGVLGAAAAVLGEPRCMCAEGIGRVTVAALTRKHLLALMARLPRFAINMNRVLASLAMESFLRSARMIHSAPVRLGKVLRDLAQAKQAAGRRSAVAVQDLTHQDLATMVGASRTWVTLTLAAFEREGMLTRKKGVIVIADLQRFDRFIASLDQVAPRPARIP